MTAIPLRELDRDERIVLRVPADPHVRIDTNHYSLDRGLVGRRVEVRVSQREITAVALDTGQLACRHEQSFAKHRAITALGHARKLRTQVRVLMGRMSSSSVRGWVPGTCGVER